MPKIFQIVCIGVRTREFMTVEHHCSERINHQTGLVCQLENKQEDVQNLRRVSPWHCNIRSKNNFKRCQKVEITNVLCFGFKLGLRVLLDCKFEADHTTEGSILCEGPCKGCSCDGESDMDRTLSVYGQDANSRSDHLKYFVHHIFNCKIEYDEKNQQNKQAMVFR